MNGNTYRGGFVSFLIGAFLVVAALRLAEEVLVPIAVAILLCFLLAPLVSAVERSRIGRVPAVLLVTALTLCVLATGAWVVMRQAADLAQDLPRYSDNLRGRIRVVNDASERLFRRFRRTVEQVQEELSAPPPPPRGAGDPGAAPSHPLWTRAAEPPLSPLAIIRSVVGPVLGPIASAGIVFVLLSFMLVQREDLRDRLIRLIGHGRLNVTTEALDEAAERVSRYLRMQLLLNTTFGLVVTVGLYLIGLPNAPLWGMIAGLLRFVPYIGAWIGALLPFSLSLAVSPSGWEPVYVAAFMASAELIVGSVLEPLLFGSSSGLSPIAVLSAAIFWTWVWGPIGLLLSTPLTVCIAVLGKYVQPLHFLTVMLSDRPALPLHLRIYQRLLAGDVEEVTTIAEHTVHEHSMIHFLQEGALKALVAAERDRHLGSITDDKGRAVMRALRDIVEELAAISQSAADEHAFSDAISLEAPPNKRITILPARDEADEIAGVIFSTYLATLGYHSEVVSEKALANEMADLASARQGLVLVSVVPPSGANYARYVLRKILSRDPDAAVIVGLWESNNELARARAQLTLSERVHVVTTLAQASEQVREILFRGVPERYAEAAN